MLLCFREFKIASKKQEDVNDIDSDKKLQNKEDFSYMVCICVCMQLLYYIV